MVYLLSLGGADGVIIEVGHVDLFALLLDIGVFADHQPTTV